MSALLSSGDSHLEEVGIFICQHSLHINQPFASVALNSARDVGGRLAAISIWGMEASGGSYAALAALTNILGMLFAALLYEIFLVDSSRGAIRAVRRVGDHADASDPASTVIPQANMEFIRGQQKHAEEHGAPPHDILSGDGQRQDSSADSTTKEKEHEGRIENSA